MKTRANSPRPFPEPPLIRSRRTAQSVAASLLIALLVCAATPSVAGETDDARAVEQLILSEDLRSARRALAGFAARYPDSPRIGEFRYRIAAAEPLVFSRMAALRLVAAEYPQTQWGQGARFELIELTYLSGDFRGAAREALRFKEAYPASPRAVQVAGIAARALLADRQSSTAKDLLDELETTSSDPYVLLALAELHRDEGRSLRARRYLQKAVERGDGDAAAAAFLLGELGREQGDRSEAARWYRLVAGRYRESFYADTARERLDAIGPTP